MQLSISKVNINPTFITDNVGYLNTYTTENTKDDLYLSYLRIKDDTHDIVIINADLLGIDHSLQPIIKKHLRNVLGQQIKVILSTTHNHYAPSMISLFNLKEINNEYLELFLSKVDLAIKTSTNYDGNFEVSYKSVNDVGIGNTRIQTKEEIIAGVLSIYLNGQRLVNLLNYNCHPTILPTDFGSFSTDYPGVLIKQLEDNYPNEHFLFLQGAAGDISTRKVRIEQSHKEMIRLSQQMYELFDTLLEDSNEKHRMTIDYVNYPIEVINKLSVINDIPDTVSKEIRFKLSQALDTYPTTVNITVVSLSMFNLIFNPWELFSSYNNYINRSNSMLVSYSQGYSGYLTSLNYVSPTYEYFIEYNDDTVKKKVIEVISKYE